ncbi:MAG: YicC family protein [Methylococcaceae bacterium]|nr:MAG: YicC family protein [Methylococcaceae bacterium]
MCRSMTAFALAEGKAGESAFTWELRSVNHRYLDVNLRLPEQFRLWEGDLRQRMAGVLKRGKVDGTLQCRCLGAGDEAIRLNQDLLRQVLQAADAVSRQMLQPAPFSALDVLRWPGVIGEKDDGLDTQNSDAESLRLSVESLLDSALAELVVVREREGRQLAAQIQMRCELLRQQTAIAKNRLPQVLQGMRDRLMARLAELNVNADTGRLEQELVFLAHKLDVAEELDRLTEHLDEVERVLAADEPVGRRLDFLMQELNREANTLGSKSADVETTRVSVEMKVLIEQMREQIQNIE